MISCFGLRSSGVTSATSDVSRPPVPKIKSLVRLAQDRVQWRSLGKVCRLMTMRTTQIFINILKFHFRCPRPRGLKTEASISRNTFPTIAVFDPHSLNLYLISIEKMESELQLFVSYDDCVPICW